MRSHPMQRLVPHMLRPAVMRTVIVMMMRMLPMKFLDRMAEMPRHAMTFVRVDHSALGLTATSTQLRSFQIRPSLVPHV